jgi:hypothetical protein
VPNFQALVYGFTRINTSFERKMLRLLSMDTHSTQIALQVTFSTLVMLNSLVYFGDSPLEFKSVAGSRTYGNSQDKAWA